MSRILQCSILIIVLSEVKCLEGCYKSQKCYFFTQQNSTARALNITRDITEREIKKFYATFCFEGLKRSYLHMWTNPVLHISRTETLWNVSSGLVTYYGESVDAVKTRKNQPGYEILQKFLASLKPFKQNEDFDLSPFNLSCYIIESDTGYIAKMNIKRFDLWFAAYLATGLVLFFSAKTWSNNSSLHYGTGVSVGILASLLLFIFILTRLMPQRLKSLGYLFMFLGSSASLWVLSVLGQMTNEPLADHFLEYWQYIFGYFIISGVTSFAIMYRFGPVSDQRTLNLIQWFLQCIGLILIYNSSQIREVSIVMIIVVLIIYNFPRAIFRNQRVKNYWQRIFPPKIKMLTEEEYIREGNEQTKKELEKLRDFCRSPDCQAWKIISRLKSPQRFTDFICGSARHITSQEIVEHAQGDDLDLDNFSDTESELVFILGSPHMRVSL